MEYLEQMRRFNLGPAGEADCPVYDGMFDYFQVLSPQWIGINTCKCSPHGLPLEVSESIDSAVLAHGIELMLHRRR